MTRIAVGIILLSVIGCSNENPKPFHIQSTYDGQSLEGFNPRHSPDGRWIAFTARRGELYDVAIIPASGGKATLLTADGVSGQPTWSPDGSKIAFAAWDSSGGSDIYVIPAAGGEVLEITTGPGAKTEPDWSPDGRQLVFSGTYGVHRDWAIWAVSAQGGEPTRLTLHSADEWSARWSADGEWVFYSSNQSIDVDINVWKIPAAGGKPEAVTNIPGDEYSAAPSPDGQMIAYLTDTMGLWTLNLATGARTNVAPGEGYYDGLSWSPDGTSVLVGRNPYPVKVRKAGLDGVTSEISMDKSVKSPVVSPDGRHIAFWSIDDEGNGDIWAVATDGNSPAIRLTSHPAAEFQPAWSPDGRWIAFVSRREGATSGDIWKVPAGGGELQRVTEFNSVRHPRWCEGGESLVFQSDPDDGLPPHIWSVPESGGSPAQITDGAGEIDPDCLGSQLIYASRGNAGKEIVVHDLKTGSVETRIPVPASARYPRWSSGGTHITFLSNADDKWEIYTLSLPDGSPVRVTNDGGKKSAADWYPDGNSILDTVQLGQQEIWQFPILSER